MRSRFLLLHGIAITLHLICTIYAFTSPSLTESLTLELETKGYANLSRAHPYFRNADSIDIMFPSVTWIHGLVALVTLVFHIFVYLPLHYKFSEIIWDQGFLSIRWLEYGITCTLMTMSSVFAAGTSDFNFLMTLIFGGVALQMVGCSIEQLKLQWFPLLILGTFIEISLGWSIVWHTISSPAITSLQWIETLSYIFFYSLFPINCVVDAIYRKERFIETDWIYNLLSLSSKLALFWLQIGKLEKNTNQSSWSDIQIYVLGIGLPLLILATGLVYLPKRPKKLIIEDCKLPSEIPPERPWLIYYYISKFRLFVPVKGDVQTIFITRKGRLRA